jgi:hypothetical protein
LEKIGKNWKNWKKLEKLDKNVSGPRVNVMNSQTFSQINREN